MRCGRGPMVAGAILLGLLMPGARVDAGPCVAPGRPLIAEILYDASGDDTGREFVELFNPGPLPRPLAGLRLEAGDGSGPGRWSLRWTGLASDTIAALGRFVIGGALVAPTPDAVAMLDLQNGPDAIRLVWPDGAAEVVGYGAHEFAEYYCVAPALDTPSGQSLARIPDDADQGGNAADLRVATPSPGAANQVRRDLALRAEVTRAEPEHPAPLQPWRLGLTIVNHGVEVVTAGEARIAVAAPPDTTALAEAVVDTLLAAGVETGRWLDVPGLDPGRKGLRARLSLAGDQRGDNDTASFVIRIGPGPLAVTEIQFHPAAGEGEWVEVCACAGERVGLPGFRLGDRRPAAGAPQEGRGDLEPGDYAVLVQDRPAFMARFPALDSARVWRVSPWSSLNNSDDPSGVADRVVLEEADGTPVETVPYSAAAAPAGFPLERSPGDVWVAAPDPGGTPLAPPRKVPEARGGFEVEPRRLTSRGGQLRWTLPWSRARLTLELYDLAGRRRATLLSDVLVPGRGERSWSPGDQRPGVYLLVMNARPEGGGEPWVIERPVQIGASR